MQCRQAELRAGAYAPFPRRREAKWAMARDKVICGYSAASAVRFLGAGRRLKSVFKNCPV